MLGIKKIQEIIPHRHPFLLIDCTEELEPDVRVVDYKCVTFNEPFFAGHFPGGPVIPGMLIIEVLIQIGSVAMLSMETYKGKVGYFGIVSSAKFKQTVRPSGRLHLEHEIIKQKEPVGIGKATTTADGRLAASAELTFMIG